MTEPTAGPMSIHPATLAPDRLLGECEQTFTRRSGPGGQNRNKVETAVILHHRPTGLSAEANEKRTQGENRAQALFRLRLLMALEIRRPPGGVPSELWRSRCRGGKVAVSPSHDDYPALLAEALDALAAHDDDAKSAAQLLGCSTTQFINLLRDEPRSLLAINTRRTIAGKHPYH